MGAWSVSSWSSAIPFVQTNEVRVVGGARIAPSGSITVVSGASIGWSSSATDPTVASDTSLTRQAAGFVTVTSGIRFPDGTAAAPSISFSGATNQGLARTGNGAFFVDGTNFRAGYNRASDAWLLGSAVIAGWTPTNADGTLDTIQGRAAAANLRLGDAAANPPVAQTLSMQNASGSNIAGASFTLDGSQGTGTGAGGSIIFRTAPAGAAGSALNALTTRLTINDTGISSTGAILFSGTNNTIGATALTVIAGGLGFDTITAAASAPGAAGGKIEWRCGTNAGTIKIVAYGGTSATGVTVVDNIGGGVTGC